MKIEYAIAFVLYFCWLLFIGLLVSKKKPTASDMLVGSRGLNYWVTALSAQASDMSSWLFMAFPMQLFLFGLPQLWIAVSLIVGMYCNWHFIAPKLRIETEKYNAYTLPTFFSRRFHDTKGTIRVLLALLSLFFLTYYLAAGMITFGILFERLHIDYMVGISIATAAMFVYSCIGGFMSVAWVDLFQAIFLLLAICIVPLLAFFKIEGWSAISNIATAKGISLSLFPDNAREILYPLGWGLGYFGMPHIVTKFMGINDPKQLTKAKYLGISWETLALFAAGAIGMIGIAYFQNGISNPQLIFIQMVDDLLHPFAAGLVLCGVIAATLSTMNSQLIVAASNITEDIYKQLFNKHASSKREVIVFRIALVVLSVAAFLIASSHNTTIMDTVSYAWTGLGCISAPLMIASLYSKNVTRTGAIAGILTGGIIASIWTSLPIPGEIPAMIPGFIAGLIAIFGVSYATASRKRSAVE